MKTITKRTRKLVLFCACMALYSTEAFTQIDIAPVQVSTIGHYFADGGPSIGTVRNFLIDQDQSYSGGALLFPVSANFDINNQFVLTITAPPGQRFVVQPPEGQSVVFAGSLLWGSEAPNGASSFGSVDVSFDGVLGTVPQAYFAQSSMLTDTHDMFGFNDIQSIAFTNAFSFTSITLTATVPSANSGSGTLAYTPEVDSALVFLYRSSQVTDPGPFVSIVPEPSVASLLVFCC